MKEAGVGCAVGGEEGKWYPEKEVIKVTQKSNLEIEFVGKLWGELGECEPSLDLAIFKGDCSHTSCYGNYELVWSGGDTEGETLTESIEVEPGLYTLVASCGKGEGDCDISGDITVRYIGE